MNNVQPGLVILLGSGETAASIRKVYHWLFERLDNPPRVSILETPAGFEPNSAQVAGRVADFLTHRLQNFNPQVEVVPARKRNTVFSPDNPDIVAPLLTADVVFMGAGSPTYAVRHLQDTLAFHTMAARHCLGAAIVLASASTLAFSAHTLPVYEIYKVGEELHWHMGLDFLGAFGLSLVCVPHWNNTEGGAALDTSRCYMGQDRFEKLLNLLPRRQTVVGIDEHTALVLDLSNRSCLVMGNGGVTLLKSGAKQRFAAGTSFAITELGAFRLPEPQAFVPRAVWDRVVAARRQANRPAPAPPPEVLALVQQREAARARRDWAAADLLREQITAQNWLVLDTADGPQLEIRL